MPDNSKGVGWARKKISNKPNALQPLRLSTDDTLAAGRHYFSRKTIHGSRPATPATPTIDETEDGRVLNSAEPTTPRRNSKPKLARYTSLFSSFKDIPEPSPNFAEPWNDIVPEFEGYVDPILTIQAIRSHLAKFSRVPLDSGHSHGLLNIFEHYYQLRTETERLETELQETRQELESTRDRWTHEERRYAEEIRRLELLIARGTTGVAGVLHARHGSVVDRKQMHRKTISGDSKMATWKGFLSQEQIDAEIRSRSHNVLLQRSTSASEKMAALSKQFMQRAGADFRVGTPPTLDTAPLLSQKMRSEFDLSKAITRSVDQSFANASLSTGFSGAGDPLPDEMLPNSPVPVELTVDCEAFVALRELATLVARRRGLDTDKLVHGLMTLFSEPEPADSHTKPIQLSKSTDNLSIEEVGNEEATPTRLLRKFQSQPHLNSEKRRRHFSFEPGEDQLQALKEQFASEITVRSRHELTKPAPVVPQRADGESPEAASPHEIQNLSKIPTPVQPFGSLRRETSVSSLGNDGRHNSQSSILTAFRENQSGTLRPGTSSRSSSFNNARNTGASPSSLKDRPEGVRVRISASPSSMKDGLEGVRVRNSSTSLVASRVGDEANHTATTDGSPAKTNPRSAKAGSSTRTTRHIAPVNKPENNDPKDAT